MDEKRVDDLCIEAGKRNQPLLARGRDLVELKWSEPPRPQASFGLINDWVEVGDTVKGISNTLLIPFQPKQLGWVKPETLQLFRYDLKKKSFEKIDQALRHPKYPVVHAIVDRAGVYGLIGLHSHPLVQETISLFCEMRVRLLAQSQKEQRAFRDEICKTILCARDFDQFWLSQEEFAEWAKNHSLEDPASRPPPLSRLAHPGETICDRCNGIDLEDFLDCHVLEPLPQRPCKQAVWENVGPKHISGAMRQIVVDPTDHRRLYAVSANGGIWRLDNVDKYPDEVWRPLTDTDDVNNLRFRTMAVAPSNGLILYAANSVKELRDDPPLVYSELYRSSDRGVHWKLIHQEGIGVVHRIVVHPANPNIVFAATSTGLWRKDAMGIWAQLFLDDCLDVQLDPTDSSIIYLGVRNRGLFKSFTSGSDWSVNPILEFNPVAAGASRKTIKVALGLNKDETPQTPTARTVVVRFGNEINVSQTSGENPNSWRRAVLSFNNSTLERLQGGSKNRSDTFPERAEEWMNCLAVDPFDPDHILVGSFGIFESRNGGQSWTESGRPHEDEHSFAFDPKTPDLVYLSNDGGVFSSVDGGTTWPTMSLTDVTPRLGSGFNLAKGLVTSEFRHSAVREGRCVATIDHTGYILTENFNNDDAWQFLFDNQNGNSGFHGGHEGSYVYSCPASPDRWYVFTARGDDDNGTTGRLAQLDFTRTNGRVNAPAFNFLSDKRTFVFTFVSNPSFPNTNSSVQFFPEDQIYLKHFPGPFAARFTGDERLLLFAAANYPKDGFTIQSVRLAQNGTVVIVETTEATNLSEPFSAITFVPNNPDRAFAISRRGELFERDFSSAGQFTSTSRWEIPENDLFVSRLIAVPRPTLSLYALSQRGIGWFNYDTQRWSTIYTEAQPNETLLALVAHPTRHHTLFLGTNRGVYVTEDRGNTWQPYRLKMPRVPITELSFDQGYLYAATLGRGLWRCRPCLG